MPPLHRRRGRAAAGDVRTTDPVSAVGRADPGRARGAGPGSRPDLPRRTGARRRRRATRSRTSRATTRAPRARPSRRARRRPPIGSGRRGSWCVAWARRCGDAWRWPGASDPGRLLRTRLTTIRLDEFLKTRDPRGRRPRARPGGRDRSRPVALAGRSVHDPRHPDRAPRRGSVGVARLVRPDVHRDRHRAARAHERRAVVPRIRGRTGSRSSHDRRGARPDRGATSSRAGRARDWWPGASRWRA